MRPQKTRKTWLDPRRLSIEPASGAGPVDCFESVLSRNLIGIYFHHQKANEFAFPGNRGVLAYRPIAEQNLVNLLSADAYRHLGMVRPREHMNMYASCQPEKRGRKPEINLNGLARVRWMC